MQLYSFFKSTACFRVRIVLALKRLPYRTIPVNLLKGDGEHLDASFGAINPQRLLPVLVTDDGTRITQSSAICEYLDEAYPAPALMPSSARDRAYVRSLIGLMASDTHPLHAIRATRYLGQQFALTAEDRRTWTKHWIMQGLRALEAKLSQSAQPGRYCCGDDLSIADAFLVPQFVSALNNDVDAHAFGTVAQIALRCLEHPAMREALPENQPDAT